MEEAEAEAAAVSSKRNQRLNLLSAGFSLRTHRNAGISDSSKMGLGSRSTLLIQRINQYEKNTRRIRMDCWVGILFIGIFLLLFIIGFKFGQIEDFPITRQLGPNEQVEGLSTLANQKLFFEVVVVPGSICSWFTFQSDSIVNFTDTTISLIRSPSDILRFNDDIAIDDKNSIVFFQAEFNETLILEVKTLQVDSDSGRGNYSLISQVIDRDIFPNVSESINIEANAIFLGKMVNLSPNKTYEVTVFEDLNEQNDPLFDTAIRIRELNGDEIIEVFQGTPYEYTARILFTPRTEGPYIIEIREFGKELNGILLVRPIGKDIIAIDIDEPSTSDIIFPLHTQVSTVIQMSFRANVEYKFNFLFELEPEELLLRQDEFFGYGYAYPEAPLYFPIYSDNLIPGIALRLYDRDNNDIIKKARTDLDIASVEDGYALGFPNSKSLFMEFIAAEGNNTVLGYNSFSDFTVLLDVIRFHPLYTFTGVDDILPISQARFGNFSFSVEARDIEPLDPTIVDENNLFPCEIDQNKHLIDDNDCEQGIILYCRYEFFPERDTTNASKRAFQDICNCVDFLCATLPGGDDLNTSLNQFLNIWNVFFAFLTLVGIIVYLGAHVDLYFYGGFKFWVLNEGGFVTWSLCFVFLIAAAGFYITKIILARELGIMKDIARNFSLDQIPIVSDEETYAYYYDSRALVLGEKYSTRYFNRSDDYYIENSFLINDSLEIARTAKRFVQIQTAVVLNLLASVLKDALAMVVFLDVSLVWISSTRRLALNKKQQERNEMMYRRIVRLIEFLYFILLTSFTIALIQSNGNSYNTVPGLFTLFSSIFVVVIYSIGRHRIRKKFENSSVETGEKLRVVIRKVSTVVIIANIGVVIVQIYSIVTISNFDDMIAAANNPQAQILFLFQDICNFTGISAIFVYLLRHFMNFRETLFVEESFNDKERYHSSTAISSINKSGNMLFKEKKASPSRKYSSLIDSNPGVFSEFRASEPRDYSVVNVSSYDIVSKDFDDQERIQSVAKTDPRIYSDIPESEVNINSVTFAEDE